MKFAKLTSLFAFITLAVLALGFASAQLSITAPSNPVNANQSAILNISTSGTTFPTVQISELSSLGLTINPSTISNLNPSENQSVIVSLSNPSNIRFGLINAQVQAISGSPLGEDNVTFQFKKTFCSAGEVLGNVTIENIDWENNGEGDDNSWELLDEIEVEVEVGNRNVDDDVDVIVELGLFDSSGKNVADDLIFLEDSDSSDEEIEINVDDDDEETVRWVFKVPADFDRGNYRLAVKAYNDDEGESNDCADSTPDFGDGFFQAVDVEEASDEGRFVVVDEIELESQVTCGQTVAGQFTVFNIGDEDQERVKILIRNQNLGIDLSTEITSDLDRGDDQTIDFVMQIPATAQNGNYVLQFITQYDYRNGVYREESDETFDAIFEVIGCSENLGNSGGQLTNTEIDARLGSDATAGEELVVIATITNTGSQSMTYSVSARGYSSWAELSDISDGTITIGAGESEEVVFTMIVNDDVSGTESFDIQVAQGGRVQVQEVEVEFSSRSGSNIFGSSNYLIWVIGAVNLLLIILIIVVAVRLSRK